MHPTLIHNLSNFNSYSGMLACILNDIFAKLGSITIQSASEPVERVWVSASSGVRRDGRIKFIKSHAAAETSRGFGRIIQQPIKLCEGVLCPVTNDRIHPKQRAGRWRAACTLTDDDRLPDGNVTVGQKYIGEDLNLDGQRNASQLIPIFQVYAQ